MPAEIIDKLYEIAQKGGYAGDQPARWEGGIAAITSAISHETPVLRDTVVDALDDLKTVAFEGGGGVDLGPLQLGPMASYSAEPVVGGEPEDVLVAIWYVKVGDSVVIEGDADLEVFPSSAYYAAGCTIAINVLDADASSVDGYIVTLDGSGKFATVAAWGGTITKTASTVPDSHDYLFTMPTLSDGERLVLYPHA